MAGRTRYRVLAKLLPVVDVQMCTLLCEGTACGAVATHVIVLRAETDTSVADAETCVCKAHVGVLRSAKKRQVVKLQEADKLWRQ